MSQPVWECIGQLGDANPIDYGGYWIFRDTTGVYSPEGELLIAPDEENGEYKIYRFDLEKCTFIDGILSDNKFHPDKSAWWAKTEAERKVRPQDTTYLKNIADFTDMEVEDLVSDFCSDDILDRARAYQSVGDYHGFDNLDHDPLTMTLRAVKARFRVKKYRVKTPACRV